MERDALRGVQRGDLPLFGGVDFGMFLDQGREVPGFGKAPGGDRFADQRAVGGIKAAVARDKKAPAALGKVLFEPTRHRLDLGCGEFDEAVDSDGPLIQLGKARQLDAVLGQIDERGMPFSAFEHGKICHDEGGLRPPLR
jgi:hypothetical protein